MSAPASCELSAVLVAGACRLRAQRVVDALCAQTALDALEIVVVDLAAASTPRLSAAAGAAFTCLDGPDITTWGRARLEGVRIARGKSVAFIEDHCFPARTWAERLMAAHAEGWVAVGYAFTNANPRTRLSRAALLARYGGFAHPAGRGPARYLSGNNVSYDRRVLLQYGDRLETLLDIDFNLQEALRRDGHPLFVEAQAIAAHQNYTTLSGECRAGRPYCRLLAAHRAAIGRWGRARRLLYGLAAPLGAPAIRLARLTWSLRGRRPLWRPWAASLPAMAAMYLSDAIGESAGYLFGAGAAGRDVLRYELETERDA